MDNGASSILWSNDGGGYLMATVDGGGGIMLRGRRARYSSEEHLLLLPEAIALVASGLIGRELFYRNEKGQIQKLL